MNQDTTLHFTCTFPKQCSNSYHTHSDLSIRYFRFSCLVWNETKDSLFPIVSSPNHLRHNVGICYSAFHHCNKIFEINSLKEESFFGSQFQSFQSMVTWPCCFGPLVTQCIMAGAHSRGSCLVHGGLGGRGVGRDRFLRSPSRAHHQENNFLPLDSTSQ